MTYHFQYILSAKFALAKVIAIKYLFMLTLSKKDPFTGPYFSPNSKRKIQYLRRNHKTTKVSTVQITKMIDQETIE